MTFCVSISLLQYLAQSLPDAAYSICDLTVCTFAHMELQRALNCCTSDDFNLFQYKQMVLLKGTESPSYLKASIKAAP